MSQPRVSVIMLTYNRAQYIGRALQSIVDQDFHAWEAIVVHDGPNEKIAEIMEDWAKADARIRYFRRARGGNIANATNFGIQQARGEYVAILDDDDFWPIADKLSKQVRFLDANSDYAGCGGGVIAIDEHGCETARFYKALTDGDIRRLALLANPMAHSTGMYRRNLILKIGGYDESLAGFQDWDVWLKLGRVGKLRNFPEYWLAYQMWPGGGSFSQQKVNTRCSVQIVLRHRRTYPAFPLAFGAAMLYYVYARLPAPVRRLSFGALSRWKKTAFAAKA